MLVHNVYFWLKDSLDETEVAAFRKGLESLIAINHVEAGFVGTPAAVAERPVLDQSFDFALTVILADVAAHDAYQADPVHVAFLENFRDSWDRVLVRDAD